VLYMLLNTTVSSTSARTSQGIKMEFTHLLTNSLVYSR
jgi:hypothetical protein